MEIAAIAFAVLAATGLFGRLLLDPGVHALSLALVLVGWCGLLLTVAPDSLLDRPLLLGCGVVAVLAVGAAAAHLLQDRPLWLIVAAAAALPLRVPVPLADETFNLLLPLYAVVGIGLIVLLGRTVRGREQPRESTAYARVLDVAVALVVAVASVSLGWTLDTVQGRVEVALFYVPFAVLYVLVRDWLSLPSQWMRGGAPRAGRLYAAAAAFVGLMSLAALVGLLQAATRTVWQNPKLQIANELAPDFRTNSIFWDPNIYGRYLVAALAVLLCVLSFVALRRAQLAASVALGALLLAALWFTYSQSSFLALTAACLVVSLMLLRRRGRIAAFAIALAAVALAIPVARSAGLFEQKGRVQLAEGGVSLIARNPVAGTGVGSFEHAYATFVSERGARTPRLRASHTTPVTVAVELGIVGLAAYAFFLTAAVVAATGMRRASESSPAAWTAHQWAAATLAAVVVHSLFYAGFFEDPLTWVCAAVIASLPPLQTTAAAS